LIPRKIVKIVATRCNILRLKCAKFDFGWGSTPDPTCQSLQCSPRSSRRVLLLREGKGREEMGQEEREGFFLYIKSLMGSEKVLENFSWGSYTVLDFLSVKEWEPCSARRYYNRVCLLMC